jgi:hypothetical protein
VAVCTTKKTVAQVPYSCDFENRDEREAWSFANSNNIRENNWYIDRSMYTNNGGDYGMYVSNDGGVSNAYYTEEKATVVHAYRELYIPESNSYQLTFDWKSAGAENDYLNVYLLPADQLPVNGQMPNNSYKINATPFYNNQNLTYSYSLSDEMVLMQGADILNFNYTGNVQTWRVPAGPNTAKLEVWGAQGGNNSSGSGGKGGYSAGTINLANKAGKTFYIQVGGQGSYSTSQSGGGYNGGGDGYYSAGGGGATDIRIGTNSLHARVLVAGGGGGGYYNSNGYTAYGGDAGGTTGLDGGDCYYGGYRGQGGRIDGGGSGGCHSYCGYSGSFGQGGNSYPYRYSSSYRNGGAGGGGWYGGGAAACPSSYYYSGGGGGGSSYCYNVSYASYYPGGCLLNADDYLTSIQLIAGNQSMPNPSGGTMTGRTGNGYARISYDYAYYDYPTVTTATNLTWKTYTVEIPRSGYPSGNYYLCFTWVNNDTTGIQPPIAIDNISLSNCIASDSLTVAATDTSAVVSWRAHGSSTQYIIEYKNDTVADWGAANTIALTSTNSVVIDTITGLDDLTLYNVRIISLCEGGNQEFSEVRNFFTCDDQQTTIVDGTGNSRYIPAYANNDNNNFFITQSIYTPNEISATGQITEIWYNVNSGSLSGEGLADVSIYMGYTNQEGFGSTTNWVSASSLTEVYRGKFTMASTGWQKITLQQPFAYDAHANLVVATRDNDRGANTGTVTFVTNSKTNGSLYKVGQAQTPYSFAASTIGTLLSQRPAMRFTLCDPILYCKVPTSLQATPGAAQIRLTWVIGNAERAWDLRWKKTSDAEWDTIKVYTNDTTFTGLSVMRTSYDFQVRAYCVDGNMSDWVSTTCFTPCGNGLQPNPNYGYTVDNPRTGTYASYLTYNVGYYGVYGVAIYDPSDLGLEIGKPTWITHLAYRFRAVQAFNPTFYIGTVTYNTKQFPSASSTSYFRDYMTNYRKVYEQPATYIQFYSGEYYNSTPTDNKWYTFRLDEPYYWDGEGNIVVGCYNYGANPNYNSSNYSEVYAYIPSEASYTYRQIWHAEQGYAFAYCDPESYNFGFTNNNWYTYSNYIPDLKLTVADQCIPCSTATNLQVTSTTSYTATFTLTNNAGVGEYEYEVGPVGFRPGDGNGMRGTTTLPYTIEPLQPNTPYDLYVRPVCPEYENANNWSRKATFATKCGTTTALSYTNARTSTNYSTEFPFWSGTHFSYSQSLYEPEELGLIRGEPKWIEGISLRVPNDRINSSYYVEPDIFFGQVSSSITGFSNAYTKSSYLPYSQLTQVLNSKTIYYPSQNTSNPESYPYYENVSSKYWWNFKLDKPYYWDGESNIVIGFYNGISNTTYSHYFYCHTPRVSHSYKTISIQYSDNNIGGVYVHPKSPGFINSHYNYTNSSQVPDVRFRVYDCTNSCPVVTNIIADPDSITKTSAYLTWSENGSATQWKVQYALHGTNNYSTVYTTVTNVKLEGLYTGVTYQVKVRAICYPGDTSNVATGYFTTLCQDTMDLPYSEDFNGSYSTKLIEHCWDDGTLSGQIDKPSISSDAIAFPTCTEAYAISPAFRTNAIGEMYVQFRARGNSGAKIQLAVVEDPTNLTGGVTYCGSPITLTTSWRGYEQSLADYAGSTAKHIAFISNGTPLYVDDVNIFSCRIPQNLTYSNVTSTTVDLQWDKGNVETDWEIRYSLVGSDPDLDGSGVIVSVSGNAYQGYTLHIEQYKDYQVEVRAVCGEYRSLFGNRVTFHTPKTPGEIPYFCDFEDSLENFGWTLNEGPQQTNEWVLGTATNNGGQQSLYISDDNGVNNSYNNARASYAFAWRDIQFDNSIRYVLSFDWRALGATNDDIYVYLTSPTIIPQNGTYWGPDSALNATPLNGSLAWQNYEVTIDNSDLRLSNKIWRLVFMWKNNDAVGDIPPGAIDNISISTSCFRPTDLIANVSGNTASLSWLPGGMEDSWFVRYEKNRDGVWHILPCDNIFYQLPLEELTYYTVQVAGLCGRDTSFWSDAVAFMVPCSNSTLIIQGTGTAYSEKIPLDNRTKFSYSQQIFTAYELEKSGSISKMDFYYDYVVPATAKNTNVRFYLGHSDKVKFDNTTDWIDKSTLTLVYDGPFNCVQGYNEINFTTPFEYNGNHSLVLLLEDESNNSNLNAGRYRKHTTNGINRTIYYNGNTAYVSGSTAGTLLAERNNIRFTFCDAADICQDLENVQISNITPTQATATWSSQGVATKWQLRYQVEPTTANGEDGEWIYANDIPFTSYTMTNLTGLNDYYRVQVRGTCPAIPDTSRWTEVVVYNNGCVTPETMLYGKKESTSQIQPFYGNTYSLTQQIYTPNEVGISSEGGYITSLTFEKSSAAVTTANPTIYLGTTTREEFTGYGSGQIIQSGDLSNVYGPYTGTIRWTATTMTFNLDRPFYYNGSDNLVVAMYIDNQTVTSPTCYSTQGTKNRTAYFYCSSGNKDNANPSSGATLGANATDGAISKYRSDIRFGMCVSCRKPSNISMINATPTTATIAWTVNSGEDKWIIEYGAKGFEKGAGTFDTVYNTPTVTLTNLLKGKHYEIYVKGVCSPTLISGYASTPYLFSTPCGVIDTLPWRDNLDGWIAGNSTSYFPYNGSTYNYDACWSLAAGTGYVTTTQKYSFPNSLYLTGGGSQTIATLPEFNEAIENLQITFEAYTPTTNSVIRIGVWSELYNTFIQLHQLTIPVNNRWDSYTFPFITYGAQDPGDRLAFQIAGTNTVYIDNVVVEELPNCQRPTQLTTTSGTENIVTVDWLNHGNPDGYIVSYKKFGEDDSLWVEDYTTQKPYTYRIGWSGMEDLCQVKVRAICGQDTSDWSPIAQYTTGCTYQTTNIDGCTRINYNTSTLTTATSENYQYQTPYSNYYYYHYSYSEQIYEPQDFGLNRGQIVYLTALSFRPTYTAYYNYIAPNFFIGTTTSVYYSSPSTYSFLIKSGTPMTKYRTSSTNESATWNNATWVKFELLSFNIEMVISLHGIPIII